MAAKKTKAPTPPPFGGLIKLSAKGWAGVPDGDSPFYFGAKDGLFLHRRSLLGRGVARIENWPTAFPEFGTRTGSFWWQADPIPAYIMGQTVSFFERIYDKQHTEAMVLLVMNQDTKEWRVFVPTQMVNHGGVKYVFDPSHIKLPWVLVGSIHSHCDFGAGHSGTDTHDAEGFDGFHGTIGMIKRPIPQIVAMMAMNKRLMHFDDKIFPQIFDFSEPKAHEAPAWWDRYVEDTKAKTKPVGFELFEKFGKDPYGSKTKITVVNPTHQPAGKTTTGWKWSNAAQRMVHDSWKVAEDGTVTLENGTVIRRTPHDWSPRAAVKNVTPSRPLGADKDDWTEFYRLQGLDHAPEGYEQFSPQTLLERGYRWDPDEKTWEWVGRSEPMDLTTESKEWNARQAAERGQARWDREGGLESIHQDFTAEELREMGLWGLAPDDHWETVLPKHILDALFDSDLLNDEDVDMALKHPDLGGDPDFWKEIFLHKVFRATHVLREMGVIVSVGIKGNPARKEVAEALLPEPTKIPVAERAN